MRLGSGREVFGQKGEVNESKEYTQLIGFEGSAPLIECERDGMAHNRCRN